MTQPSLPLEAAPAPWSGKLSELMPILSAEARAASDGAWRWRQLRHGALVSVQVGAGDRRVLRIARAHRPTTKLAGERWALELQTFEKHLGVGGWQRSDETEAPGVAVRYLELWEGEVAPGKAECGRCQKRIPFDKVWGGRQRCETCARLDGDDETRDIQARLAREAGEHIPTTEGQTP